MIIDSSNSFYIREQGVRRWVTEYLQGYEMKSSEQRGPDQQRAFYRGDDAISRSFRAGPAFCISPEVLPMANSTYRDERSRLRRPVVVCHYSHRIVRNWKGENTGSKSNIIIDQPKIPTLRRFSRWEGGANTSAVCSPFQNRYVASALMVVRASRDVRTWRMKSDVTEDINERTGNMLVVWDRFA